MANQQIITFRVYFGAEKPSQTTRMCASMPVKGCFVCKHKKMCDEIENFIKKILNKNPSLVHEPGVPNVPY